MGLELLAEPAVQEPVGGPQEPPGLLGQVADGGDG